MFLNSEIPIHIDDMTAILMFLNVKESENFLQRFSPVQSRMTDEKYPNLQTVQMADFGPKSKV